MSATSRSEKPTSQDGSRTASHPSRSIGLLQKAKRLRQATLGSGHRHLCKPGVVSRVLLSIFNLPARKYMGGFLKSFKDKCRFCTYCMVLDRPEYPMERLPGRAPLGMRSLPERFVLRRGRSYSFAGIPQQKYRDGPALRGAYGAVRKHDGMMCPSVSDLPFVMPHLPHLFWVPGAVP